MCVSVVCQCVQLTLQQRDITRCSVRVDTYGAYLQPREKWRQLSQGMSRELWWGFFLASGNPSLQACMDCTSYQKPPREVLFFVFIYFISRLFSFYLLLFYFYFLFNPTHTHLHSFFLMVISLSLSSFYQGCSVNKIWRYYIHFWTNTLGKNMNPLILPAMG